MLIFVAIWGVANTAGLAIAAWHACKHVRAIKAQIAGVEARVLTEADCAREHAVDLLTHALDEFDGHAAQIKDIIAVSTKASERAVLDAFVPHADKLHSTVEDLRTSARTMHDQAQARAIAPRIVPERN